MTSSTNSRQTSGSSLWRRRQKRITTAPPPAAPGHDGPGCGAVEQHALVAVADVEQLADLGGGASDEIAQRDHGPLLVRELLDRMQQLVAQLGAEQAGLRVAVEPRRRARPAAFGSEGRRVDGRAVLRLECGERQAAGIASRARARLIEEDAEDPRPQRRAALEGWPGPAGRRATSPGPRRPPPPLCGRSVRATRRRPAVVAGHEHLERPLVTGAQTAEEHVVVVHRIVKLPVTCNARTLSVTHRGMTHLHPQIVRDDRMLPATRWAALIVFFAPRPGAAILWVAPDRTG